MEIRILEENRFVDTRIGISYRIVYSESEKFTEHAHEYYEIFVMLSGRAKHSCNGKNMTIGVGDIFFIRPSDLHRFSIINNEVFSFINLTFTKETFDSLRKYLGAGFPFEVLLLSESSPCAQLSSTELAALESRIAYLSTITYNSPENLKTALRIMLIELFISHFYNYLPPTKKTPLWLERLLVTMRSDGNFALGIDRMVELSGKTREHLSRTVKKHLGQTLTEIINEIRINYIANRLKSSKASITDIVLDSGFNSMSRATYLFKEKHGQTMREFRNNT